MLGQVLEKSVTDFERLSSREKLLASSWEIKNDIDVPSNIGYSFISG